MIRDEHLGFIEAVRAIAAARRVDWAAIESSTQMSDSLIALLRQLRVIADIAELHRSLPLASVTDGRQEGTPLQSDVRTSGGDRPSTWGPLQLFERVGHGAFADVFRAWDPKLDREVALKLLHRPNSRSGAGSAVIEEGRMLARIRHPNVVAVYGADRVDGEVGLWMEFVRGRTLEAVLHDHGPFGAQEAAIIGLDVCRALSAVHHAGLIHRDVKAQNVVREAGGRVVLMDLGAGLDQKADASDDIAGTPLYQAPEVFLDQPATPQSDIYSVGVLLYHLVTAHYPVKGQTVGELREAHRAGRRSWLRDERPDLPAEFIQTVETALEHDPFRRYESAGAMESALTQSISSSRDASHPEPRSVLAGFGYAAGAAAAVLALGLLSPTWRGAVLARFGRSNRPGAVSATVPSSKLVRRIPLDDFSVIGRPSPDGTLFSATDGAGNVTVFEISTGRVRHVTSDATFSTRGSQSADATTVSPDNQYVAYGWHTLDGKFELRVTDLEGQQPRVLLRDASIESADPLQWSNDGRSVLTTLTRYDHTTLLALVSVDEGTVRPVKELGTDSVQSASLSSDGKFIAYDFPQQRSAEARDIFIVRSDGTDNRRLVEHQADDAQPVWSPDGGRVLFTSDRSGTMDIWSVAVDQGVAQGHPQIVHRNVGRMLLRGLTASGSYYYLLTAGAVDVYEARLAGGVVTDPTAVPSYSGSNISSIWSPDGRRVAYASRRGLAWFSRGSTTLTVRDVRTGERRDLAPSMKSFLVRSWSPDGRFVLVQGAGNDGRQGMRQIDAENGRVAAVLVDGSSARPDWLPDGRIMYYNRPKRQIISRDVHSGAEEIALDPRAEGGDLAADISGRGYKLSPDGQTLAFTLTKREGRTSVRSLVIKPFGGGASRELVRAVEPDSIMFQDWAPDSAALLFTRAATHARPESLWRVSINGGEPQPLGLAMIGLRDVSVRSDGAAITFTAGWPDNELWVLENFLSEK
jgi:serine/threonine protein kinase/Tol biopolymer transport system component